MRDVWSSVHTNTFKREKIQHKLLISLDVILNNGFRQKHDF